MNIIKRSSRKGDKEYYYFEFGRCAGSRIATKIFTYTYPKNQIEKNHNKEALKLLETKKSELNIEQQAVGSGFIPVHKFKGNFLDYYQEYLYLNKRKGNRHLTSSLIQFKDFLKRDFLSPIIFHSTDNCYPRNLLPPLFLWYTYYILFLQIHFQTGDS